MSNIPKCLQVLKSRQLQKNEPLRQPGPLAKNQNIKPNIEKQNDKQKNYVDENVYNQQDDPYFVPEKPQKISNNIKKEVKISKSNPNVSIQKQYRYQEQQQFVESNYYDENCIDETHTEEFIYNDMPSNISYREPNCEMRQDNMYKSVDQTNLDQFQSSIRSAPQQYQQESQFIDPREYEQLVDRNKYLEKQIENLQMKLKSFSEMKGQEARLEEALNRIANLEELLSAKETKIQIATEAIADFQSEINELTIKYKKQGTELLEAQKRIKDLELNAEMRLDMNYSNQNKDDFSYEPYPSDYSRKKYDDYDSYNDGNFMGHYQDTNDNGRFTKFAPQMRSFDDDYNRDDQPSPQYINSNQDDMVAKMNSRRQMLAKAAKFDNRTSYEQPFRLDHEPAPNVPNSNQTRAATAKSSVHPAMRDNLFFGRNSPVKKDRYAGIVPELRDEELRQDYETFKREKDEKERLLSKAPEKGVSISHARRMKEEYEADIEDLDRKLSIVKREMKQRGLYC